MWDNYDKNLMESENAEMLAWTLPRSTWPEVTRGGVEDKQSQAAENTNEN